MGGLVVASNRGPFALAEGADGTVSARPAGGGLAPSLAAALSASGEEACWVACAMSPVERRVAAEGALPTEQEGLSLALVDLPEEVYRSAYDVVANQTLWFCHHGLFDASRRPVFDDRWREAWEGFRAYNLAVAERICEEAPEGARVLVNDYHLCLAGKLIAERRGDLETVHFTHTPFAAPSELGLLPRDVRRELLEAMAGFGACGFHTERWRARFDESVALHGELAATTFAAPLGADPDRLAQVAASPACAAAAHDLEQVVGSRLVVARSDRVELSKNLLRGFLAFDALLEQRPAMAGRVVFVARAYSSREGLAEYLAYRSETEHLVARLNEKWAARTGEPPIVLEVEDDFPASVALLQRYDVLLVNPIRDGMNLVAKEGPVLNRHDGLVVLSEEAGAFAELGEEALGIQPFDVTDTAAALARALEMPAGERRRRSAALARLGAAHRPAEWLSEVLSHARRPSR